MMGGFQFELVTPEKLLYSGIVVGVVVPGSEGDFEVMAGHSPLMSTLRAGLIGIREGAGHPKHIFVRGGFAEVGPAGLTILAEQAIPLEELNPDVIAAEIEAVRENITIVETDEERTAIEIKISQLEELRRVNLN